MKKMKKNEKRKKRKKETKMIFFKCKKSKNSFKKTNSPMHYPIIALMHGSHGLSARKGVKEVIKQARRAAA